jgi:beta-lactamase class A
LAAEALTHASLAQALLAAVRAQDFGATADSMQQGARIKHFPSVDLAVIAFPHNAPPVWANVLFWRDVPQGMAAEIPANAAAVRGVQWLADQTDARHRSIAWWPEADWSALKWRALHGDGPQRFVVPYPASLLKLMVAVGVARLCDGGHAMWNESFRYQGQTKTLAAWAELMMTVSDNDATSALVALLHARQAIARTRSELNNQLHVLFDRLGLPTLRIANTRADGRWTNGAAGVGNIHMTAWDTARLLWLLRSDLPAAPWLAAGEAPVLSEQSRQLFWRWMGDQALHEVLSSTVLAGVPGWQRGIAARLPPRWIAADGSALVQAERYPADVRPASQSATAQFLHKTGTTENYASDAGLVLGNGAQGRRYLIALITNLGTRYAPNDDCATTWRVPQLGRAIDDWLKARLEKAA